MDVARGKVFGRKNVGCCEDWFAAKGTDAGLVKDGVGAINLLFGAGAFGGAVFLTASGGVGIIELGNDAMEALALLGGKLGEKAAIGIKAFEQFDCKTEVIYERVRRGRGCRHLVGFARESAGTRRYLIIARGRVLI